MAPHGGDALGCRKPRLVRQPSCPKSIPRTRSELERLAAGLRGSRGALFLLPVRRENPHADANARGGFIGIDLRHDRRHYARAVFEGVAHGLADCLRHVRSTGAEADLIRLSGGGVRSALWRQACADLFEAPVSTTSTTEGTAYGAAILAAVGAGRFPDVESACSSWVDERDRVEPGPDSSRLLARHDVYEQLYPALGDLFPAIAGVPGSEDRS